MTRQEVLQIAKPILFNTEMVRAILEDRKTATRRCVKAKSKKACGFFVTFRKSDNAFMGVYDYDENEVMYENPQTQPAYVDDILYVRETWQYIDFAGENNGYVYKASENGNLWETETEEWTWKPSIHMPKEAARIFLKVTGVRVERLQDIAEEQALKEGCNSGMLTGPCTARGRFEELWNSTIKKSDMDMYGWNANPWVWVIEFERLEVEVPDADM